MKDSYHFDVKRKRPEELFDKVSDYFNEEILKNYARSKSMMHIQEKITVRCQTLTGNASMKTPTKATVNNFLLLDKLDTSSKGPGCLNIVMKIIRNAIITNSAPTKSNRATDAKVKASRGLSPARVDLAT